MYNHMVDAHRMIALIPRSSLQRRGARICGNVNYRCIVTNWDPLESGLVLKRFLYILDKKME